MATRRQAQGQQQASRTNNAGRSKSVSKKQRPFLIELFDILPTRWKGIAFGLLISLAPSYLISVTAGGDQRILSIVPLLGFIATGYVVGIVMESSTDSER